MPKSSETKSIYQLKITLLETDPPIWRRLLVEKDVTLAKLAEVTNIAMGWESCHLHEFRAGKEYWRPTELAGDFGDGPKDHRRTTLAQAAPRKRSSLMYLYDMGDHWMHKIVVEDVLAPTPKQRYPVCLEGERACPPEDCGGIPGYYNLLDALADPKHLDHENGLEWIDDPFDPAAFPLEEVNKALKRLR